MREFLIALWSIMQPMIMLLISTIGPIFVAWIGAKVVKLLNVTDEAKKLDVEQKLRDALHQSAANALAYAVTKSGIALNAGIGQTIGVEVVKEAIDYVQEKNPETLEKLGMSRGAISDVILSKVPELIQTLSKKPAGA